ncbi:MAG: tetratricopeptide (TPR) repeat protein [Myxococcota bacterium]|jgi:tetratricopeptide (TPR) repeat protein
MLSLLFALASAQTSADVLTDQAIARIETGDYAGALILLDTATTSADGDPDRLSYLRAVTIELDGSPEQAIPLYNGGLDQWPDSALHDDRIFRLAEATATIGRPRRALRILRTLNDAEFSGDDRVKLDLVRGIAWLEAGRERRGKAILSPILEQASPEQVTFYQAKARMAWARILAEEAERLDMHGREKKVIAELQARAQLLADVEGQVTAAAQLQEPEWVLEGLLILGTAYAGVGEALMSSSRPKGLTDGQLTEYDALIGQRAIVVLTKGSRHYGSGIDLAARLGWQSRRVAQLDAAKAALDAQIERLDAH